MINNKIQERAVTIIGGGYVGLSLAALLASKNKVHLIEKDSKKIECIKSGNSNLNEHDIDSHLKANLKNLSFSESIDKNVKKSQIVIFALPTDYDENLDYFDTKILTECIQEVSRINKEAIKIIKSTVPVGYTSRVKEKYRVKNLFFSPEFLREGKAINDNLNPSRIIIGGDNPKANDAGILFQEIARNNPKIIFAKAEEAESIKLFSNTYLALRIAFFNELDSYCLKKGISPEEVINGVSLDPRIGEGYNNPSFGYGGYCLPKDTKQLLANYNDVPQNLIKAIVDANATRKNFIADNIISNLDDSKKVIGIYRLTMKQGSDNIRQSSIQGIMKRLKSRGLEILVYEPLIQENIFFGSEVVKDKDEFFKKCCYIITNRYSVELDKYKEKVFTRDIFGNG
tara:strand:+ start:2578 stop:3774 length:1197 start_codon:yes stop_codon:yes gene_type:complete